MFNNLNSTLKKVVVVFLIITLTYANLVLIGSNIVKEFISYAAETETAEPTAVANQVLYGNTVKEINGEQKRIIQVYVESGIESEAYPIKETTLTLNTNIIEGTLEDVRVINYGKNSYTTGTYEYLNGILTIKLINENETLTTKEKGLDQFIITYVFSNTEVETIGKPLQKVEITPYSGEKLTVNVESGNFENIDLESTETPLFVINEDIHKTTINDGQFEFEEIIFGDIYYRTNTSNIVIEDEQNIFYNIDGTENTDLKLNYKTTNMFKDFILDLLDKEGKLIITDTKTDKVLVELTHEELKQEQSIKQYFTADGIRAEEGTDETELRSLITITDEEVIIEYEIDVTKFKVELTKVKEQSEKYIETSNVSISNIKTISNINDLENLDCLKQKIKYTLEGKEETTETTITFKDTVTKASLEADNTKWVVGEANTVKYTITLDTSSEKTDLYVDPMFLIELPSSVESVNTANSEFTINNDGEVFVSKKVFVTTVLGRKFVVISLQGAQTEESIANGNTTIDLTLELNIAADATEEANVKLYYQNNTVTAYESGKGFDTAEVTVTMVMESEPKDEIQESNPDEEEATPAPDDVLLVLNGLTNEICGVEEGGQIWYRVCITNGIKGKEKENLELTGIIPEGTTLEKIKEYNEGMKEGNELEYTFDEATRKFTVNLNSLKERKDVDIYLKVNSIPEGVDYKEISFSVELMHENTVIVKSEEVVNNIGSPKLEITTEDLPETVNELEEIILNLKIKNKEKIKSKVQNLTITAPEEISLKHYTLTILNEDGEEGFTTEAKLNTQDFNKNYIIIEPGEEYNLQIKGIVNEIEENKKITITGGLNETEFSWTTELIDKEENPDTPGKPENPDEPQNPEVPDFPGTQEKPEDPEKPENPEKPDETEKFDLSLNQYLEKVTVTNSKGTTTYNYKNTDFAKVEIHAKQMNGSKVTFEYSIVVKNEGTIPGYARKIVDYIPEGVTFNANQNPDWYLAEDGNIYSVALLEKLLQPGETAKLKLILEKQMTRDNVGTVTNVVEIYEATNEENAEDINSIPGDKVNGQNDMSKVEVMIVTSTGTIILYTTLAIVILTIIGFGFYKVKKVTLTKKGGC